MEQLYKEYEKTQEEIRLIGNKISELDRSDERYISPENYKLKFRKLFEEESNLLKKSNVLAKKISFSIPPMKSNNIIDLRSIVPGGISCYIYIHGTDINIGKIEYRGYHVSEEVGDIGYVIHSEFQGNGYASQALMLFSEKLYEDGIPDFWIVINQNNIASIKTVEKHGGQLLKAVSKKDVYQPFLFQCPTKKRIELEQSKTSKI